MHQCCPEFVRNIFQFSQEHPFILAVATVVVFVSLMKAWSK